LRGSLKKVKKMIVNFYKIALVKKSKKENEKTKINKKRGGEKKRQRMGKKVTATRERGCSSTLRLVAVGEKSRVPQRSFFLPSFHRDRMINDIAAAAFIAHEFSHSQFYTCMYTHKYKYLYIFNAWSKYIYYIE
jgi:hypothetical protein